MPEQNTTTYQHHDLTRGKSRPCVKCSYVFGCCKKCGLCRVCHDKAAPVVYRFDNRRLIEQVRKEDAIRNPGELRPFRFDGNYED